MRSDRPQCKIGENAFFAGWCFLERVKALAMALLDYGNNLWRLGDSVAGDALIERERRESPEGGGCAEPTSDPGKSCWNPDRARWARTDETPLAELIEIAQALGNKYMVVRQLTHGQGRLAMEDGDYRRARSLFEESLALGLGREKEIGPETLRRMGELSYLEKQVSRGQDGAGGGLETVPRDREHAARKRGASCAWKGADRRG